MKIMNTILQSLKFAVLTDRTFMMLSGKFQTKQVGFFALAVQSKYTKNCTLEKTLQKVQMLIAAYISVTAAKNA